MTCALSYEPFDNQLTTVLTDSGSRVGRVSTLCLLRRQSGIDQEVDQEYQIFIKSIDSQSTADAFN